MERNDELSALYAEAVANIVHVTLADGRTLTKRVDYPLGNAKNRLKDSEWKGSSSTSRRRRSAKKVRITWSSIAWKLDEATDVSKLMKFAGDFGLTDARERLHQPPNSDEP